jgi:hypothetical protein
LVNKVYIIHHILSLITVAQESCVQLLLSTLTIFSLNPMGHYVAGKVAKSQASQTLETLRDRQAQSIKLCYAKHIEDTTRPESDWQVGSDVDVKYKTTGVH